MLLHICCPPFAMYAADTNMNVTMITLLVRRVILAWRDHKNHIVDIHNRV